MSRSYEKESKPLDNYEELFRFPHLNLVEVLHGLALMLL